MPAYPLVARDDVFSNLPSSDVSVAVVGRIRAAIGLGLLTDSERLPKEAELAKRFGISIFSLREALGLLRAEGLIQTRAGKYGGSFVRRPAQVESLARRELASLSFTQLRDLGDWRQMLVSQAGELAALRASGSDIARLVNYADRVAGSDSAEQARRAIGRFHLELAAAGQSMRLNQAEFGMHEQLDWMFGLVLNDAESRQAKAAELHAIIAAIRAQDSQLARVSAGAYMLGLVEELARLRLAIIADRPDLPGLGESTAEQSSIEAEMDRFTSSLVDQLRGLAAIAAPILGGQLKAQDIRAHISLLVLQHFDDVPSFVDGLGVLAEVGVVPGHRYWIDWWRLTDQGPKEDVHHVMDPNSENFYNYEDREFMTHSRDHLEDWASGPYVDYGGVDDYTITISSPIVAETRFLGTAAVDVRVAALEHQFSPWFAAVPGSCVLLNADKRVIVSNSIAYRVGDIVRAGAGDRVIPLSALGWSLVTSQTKITTFTR